LNPSKTSSLSSVPFVTVTGIRLSGVGPGMLKDDIWVCEENVRIKEEQYERFQIWSDCF
jgi:hypothetical protein